MTQAIDFLGLAHAMMDELVETRRDLHKHPELAFEEFRTSGIVADTLDALGLEVQRGVGQTGVIGILEGAKDGPTVLMRADMDALPIEEQNTAEYASNIPGKMHACGHDGHTAILLAVAKLLAQYREEMSGRIKFVFQPAEEIGMGAKAMIDDGALENPRPDVSLGLHLFNDAPYGELGVAEGAIMSGVAGINVEIKGKGGHSATPEITIDPIVCASQVVTALQTIISRNLSASESGVISITMFHGGTALNVIPDNVKLGGTIRYLSHETLDTMFTRARQIIESTCQAFGCSAEIELVDLMGPVMNNPEVVQRARASLEAMLGKGVTLTDARWMASEDMTLFMSDIPGMFFFVGSANAEKQLNYAHHHPRFDFDERALPLGVAVLASAAADYVLPSN